MTTIDSAEALEALYGVPGEAAVVKATDRLLPSDRAWIERSRFCVISTVGTEGPRGSPRGDKGLVARMAEREGSIFSTGAATTRSTPCATSCATAACR